MATEFGTGKTIFILAIVAGCFAILWPKIFYPMLLGSIVVKPNVVNVQGCCEVMFDNDINAIKIMTQMCETILTHHNKKYALSFQQGKLTKDIIDQCKNEVLSKCDVDITLFLIEKVRLGKTYKQMLDDIRSLNSSFCLKQNFGLSPALIGAPRRMRMWSFNISKQLKQERPPHIRPDIMHPALREKGQAIPHSHIVPKILEKEGRPGPLPGMRPPMGGAGHVVAPPKGSGTMGIIMPLYTIGIVIFFMYTMMKLLFKKSEESAYKDFTSDPEFQQAVFNDSESISVRPMKDAHKIHDDNSTKLVMTAISGLVEEVNRDILSKQTGGTQPDEFVAKVANGAKPSAMVDGDFVTAGESPEQTGQKDEEIQLNDEASEEVEEAEEDFEIEEDVKEVEMESEEKNVATQNKNGRADSYDDKNKTTNDVTEVESGHDDLDNVAAEDKTRNADNSGDKNTNNTTDIESEHGDDDINMTAMNARSADSSDDKNDTRNCLRAIDTVDEATTASCSPELIGNEDRNEGYENNDDEQEDFLNGDFVEDEEDEEESDDDEMVAEVVEKEDNEEITSPQNDRSHH